MCASESLPMNRSLSTLSCVGIALTVAVSGCAKPVGSVVTGTVTIPSGPPVEGTVFFYCAANGCGAEAVVQSSGTYATGPLLKPGTYVVAVLPPPPPNGTSPDAKLPESPIPRRYRDLGKTPLKCEVNAGKNEFPIELVK